MVVEEGNDIYFIVNFYSEFEFIKYVIIIYYYYKHTSCQTSMASRPIPQLSFSMLHALGDMKNLAVRGCMQCDKATAQLTCATSVVCIVIQKSHNYCVILL